MKNLITGIACIMVLSIFMMQIAGYQVAHSKILFAETLVNSAVEMAKQDGCFTQQNVQDLQKKLSKKLKCKEDEIIVEADSIPVSRGKLISYSISYPIKGVLAAPGLLGISTEENTIRNTITGNAASEYIDR